MAYNPGISYRGEMLGQAIGQAGQGLAQAYGQGLQLKEQNKQRKQLKKSLEIQAELLGGDKDEIATMGLGELQGFVEGTRAQRQFEYEGLRLQELKGALEEDKQGKFAMSQMQSYVTGGIDPMTALNQALADVPDINPRTALALREFATSGMKMDLEMAQAENRSRALDLQAAGQEISQGTLDVQRDQTKLTREKFEESKKAPATRTFKTEGGREYDQVGDRIFPVEDDAGVEIQTGEGRAVAQAVETIYKTVDEDFSGLKEGDEKYGLGNVIPGAFYREERMLNNAKSAAKANRQFKRVNGKESPDFVELVQKMLPKIVELLDSSKESERALGKKWQDALGLVDDRKK